MNLFTKYTPEETSFLLEIAQRDVNFSLSIFSGVDKNELKYFKIKKILKKEVVKDFDFVVIQKGKVGVVNNSKIVKILNEGDCFGVLNMIDKSYLLLGMEESEVIFFDVGESIKMYKNILNCIAKNLNGKIII